MKPARTTLRSDNTVNGQLILDVKRKEEIIVSYGWLRNRSKIDGLCSIDDLVLLSSRIGFHTLPDLFHRDRWLHVRGLFLCSLDLWTTQMVVLWEKTHTPDLEETDLPYWREEIIDEFRILLNSDIDQVSLIITSSVKEQFDKVHVM